MRAHHKKQFGVGLDGAEPRLSECVDQLYTEKAAVVVNVDAYRRRATMDVPVDNHHFIHKTWVQDSLLHLARFHGVLQEFLVVVDADGNVPRSNYLTHIEENDRLTEVSKLCNAESLYSRTKTAPL
jgi:hypothetical protein